MSVIVAGGGMVGAMLAIAISRLTSGKLLVHLVEEALPHHTNHSVCDDRALVLSQGTYQQLIKIGVWEAISCFATPIRSIHISDRGHIGFVILEARDYWINELGYVIKLHDARLCLFNLLQNTPGVVLSCPRRVVSFTRNNLFVSVTLDNGEKLEGKLLVAADGSCSPIAAKCGILFQQESYNQVAIIASVGTSANYSGRAWERFTQNGPLAILPISQKKYSLVWCNSKEKTEKIMTFSDDQFCDKLQEAFGWRLGRITNVGNRIAYPLIRANATRTISHRIVLVGNAAQTIHPVAGQGFNLGLRDAMRLAETLAIAWSKQKDCGAFSFLNHYYHRCRLDRSITSSFTDGLVNLFTNQWGPLIIGRNFGMIALELFTPMRNLLAKRAMGWVIR